MRSDWKTIF
ncbi:unnamed protein product [Oppiella nova]|uniref:Uncharacterized protein n=1 Tax=Oppiella nova TaxID=334625 RepID=A0A7R9MMM4_9ACAR|nr:unnamed protein product [Oppiella nova]CAG2180185.1 unnamed protein product [Oppiella nova]